MSETNPPLDFAIVVVGAGPTGLTTANLLARYGIDTLLVEAHATTVLEPRAVSIDDESLRTMQAIGVIGEVLKEVVAGYGSEYYTPGGHRFLTVAPTGTPYGYPRRNAFRQPVLEAQLRTHLEQLPAVETWFGWQLKRFEQNEAQVTLELAGPDGARRTISCGYMIGADGASSLVRTTLGAHLEGETFAERWLIVDLDNSPAASRETQVFCDSRRPCIALPGPHGTRRFEFKLHRDEKTDAMLDPEQVARLLASHRADPDSVIRRQTVYTFHARVASRWSFGRVHLAGDACHLTPPFAGQGMNSGIRDAHNLAWKLAAVVSGQIGPGLLDTYERERRPHVGEMIKLALRMGRIMGPTSPLAGAIVQSGFRALSLWPGARDYFAQMKYKPKPRFADGFLLKDAVSARRTAVGRLLPQPRVSTQDHDAILLDELLGDGFVLLALTDDVDRFAQETSQEAFARLRVRRIAATSAGTAADNGITAIHDPSGALAAFAYGKPGQVLLIRPDRYVAGSFALSETAAFAQRLDALLRHMGSPPAPAQMALARPEARERA